MRRFGTVFLMMSAMLAGCGGGTTGGDAAPPAMRLEKAFPKVTFDKPLFLATAPGDTRNVYVVTQPGLIYVVENRADASSKRVFLDLQDRVSKNGGEEGLLGLAFHPDFASNGMFYVYYALREAPRRTRVSYFVAPDDRRVADPVSERVLLDIPQPDFSNHKGGSLAFGPDGMLYIAVGDGGGTGDPGNNAQNLTVLLGKILRLRTDGGIPADNPYVGADTAGVRDEVWAFGLRNPWRISFDRATGQLWAGDVGQSRFEEINLIEPSKNYGWRRFEGRESFNNPETLPPILQTEPLFVYGHDGGNCSITGGYVYRGKAIPALAGRYVYADFCSGRLWALKRLDNGSYAADQMATVSGNPASFGEDAAGELYIVSFEGGDAKASNIYRILPQ